MKVKRYIFLAGILALFACASHKEKQLAKDEVSIHVNNAMPHCGGMAPAPDVVYPIIEAIPNCELALFKVEEANKEGISYSNFVSNVVSDENGCITISLKKGKYKLLRPSKMLKFEDFIIKEKPNLSEDYNYRNEDCFRSWYIHPDFEFEVGEKRTFEFNYKNNCFVGSHPCLEYDGPWPP
jgi:hypothetical protein